MKILHLCKKAPYPIHSGEAIASDFLAKGLKANGVELDILAMNLATDAHPKEKTLQNLSIYDEKHVINIDNRVKALPALKALVTNQSYHISRFYNEEYNEQLIELLTINDYDYIILETLYITPYIQTIKKYSKVPIIYRSHNIEHLIWERNLEETTHRIKRAYLKILVNQLKAYELSHLNRYDLILPISPVDEQFYKQHTNCSPTYTFPIGIDLAQYMPVEQPKTFDLYFIGSLDWVPNIEGLKWFIQNIWPTLYKKHKLSLHIAGRNATAELKSYLNIDGIHFHGEVENALRFHQEHHTMIVPLNSGSGMRVKIIEAMALAKPIISTTIGAEGINVQDQKEIFICDELNAYDDAINKLKNDVSLAQSVGQNARKKIDKEYEFKSISKNLLKELKNRFGTT